MLMATRVAMMITGTTQVGKLEPSGTQYEMIKEEAASSAGIVKAQLVKYTQVS